MGCRRRRLARLLRGLPGPALGTGSPGHLLALRRLPGHHASSS